MTHCDMAVFHCRCAFPFPFQAASQASKLTLSQSRTQYVAENYVAEKKAEVVCIRRETGFGVLEAPGEDYTLEGKSSRDF